MNLVLIALLSFALMGCTKESNSSSMLADGGIRIDGATDATTADGSVITEVVPCSPIGGSTTWDAPSIVNADDLAVGVDQDQFRIAYGNTVPGTGAQISQRVFADNVPIGDTTQVKAPTPGAESVAVAFDTERRGFLAYTDNFPTPKALHVHASAGLAWDSQPREGFLGAPSEVQRVSLGPHRGLGFVWAWSRKRRGDPQSNDLFYAVTDALGTLVRAPQQVLASGSVVDVTVAHNQSSQSGQTSSAIVFVTSGAQYSRLWVATVLPEGSMQEPIPLSDEERPIVTPISAIRVSNTATMAAWTERATGGMDQVHLQQLGDDGTRLVEQTIQASAPTSLPSLANLYGVPVLAYRAQQTQSSSAIWLTLRLPDGTEFGDGVPLQVGVAVDDLMGLDIQANGTGVGVVWFTTQSASFSFHGCTR